MSAAVRRRASVGRSHCNTSSALGHFCSGHMVQLDPPHGPLPALRDTASEQEGDGPWWGGDGPWWGGACCREGESGEIWEQECCRTGLPKGLSGEPAPSHPAMGTLLFWVSLPPGELSLAPTPVLATAQHGSPPSPNSQPHPTPRSFSSNTSPSKTPFICAFPCSESDPKHQPWLL